MNAARVLVLIVVVVAFGGGAALARRAPGPGGTATVSVPPELVPAVLEAHVYAPLLVPLDFGGRDEGSAIRPALPGAPGFASTVLTRVAVDDAGKRWRLSSLAPAALLGESVARCLSGDSEIDFAASALRAAGISAEIVVEGADVVVRTDEPVHVLPALLSFCPLRGVRGAPTGAYAPSAPGRLSWRSGSFDPPPLLGAIEVRGSGGGDRADVAVNGSSGGDDGGATLIGPWADVVVLVQGAAARDRDPFGLAASGGGMRAFRGALRADVLAASVAGRGGPTDALLPPGVAPARPLPASAGSDERTPLPLLPVAADAPRLPMSVDDGDPLLQVVAGRLAVLLRARGAVLDTRHGVVAPGGCALVRWRPPVRDAALALLAFLGERPELLDDPAIQRVLDVRALLAADEATRLAAALALERALLDTRLVIPLLVVDRWLTIDPDLHGVTLRDDGVPLLDGAWWGGGR